MILPAFWHTLSKGVSEVEDLRMQGACIEGRVKETEGYFKEASSSSFGLVSPCSFVHPRPPILPNFLPAPRW